MFKGYCFEVMQDVVIWPNGKKLDRDMITHPGVSVILPLVDAKHVVMIRQFRYAPQEYLWELPAGTIDLPETPLACAKREIQEEIGYRAKSWEKITHFYPSPGFNAETIHAFIARGLVQTAQRLEHDELIECHVFALSQIKTMIKKRQIVDAKSLIPLFYFLNSEYAK